MADVLSHNAYGKSGVRLTKVTRRRDGRHDLLEVEVGVELEGDFARSYTHGDNSLIVATDTMKNTVYALAKVHEFDGIEAFGRILGEHFVTSNHHVTQATVRLSQVPFQRIEVGGKPHAHAFAGGGSERRTATVVATREGTAVVSGVDGLLILKTTRSAFKGYLRDRYTTLKETEDRIFATVLKMDWTYNTDRVDYNAVHAKARATALGVFAFTFSHAVQQTLFQMGEAVIAACPEVEEVALEMPNKHRILANLEPFGLTNANEIFVTTDEPFGLIRGTVKRDH